MAQYAGWIEYDKQTNAEAEASRSAVEGKAHVIYTITATLGTALTDASKLVALKDGTTTIWEGTVTTGQETSTFEFTKGISITPGAAVSATLEAGGSGIIGTVSIHGETI